jgi:hypothetical protein
MTEIDLSLYVRAPVMDVPSAVALGVSVITAVPKDAPPAVKTAAKKLRVSVVALQTLWGASEAPVAMLNKRAADSATDNGWGCLESRLAAYSRLPAAEYPMAPRALEIHSALFSTGLDFLTLPYKTQWAQGERRLKLIQDSGFASDIDLIAGPEFLAEVKRTHKAYGDAVGVTKPEELPPEVGLVEPLRAVGRALVDYSLQLLAYASNNPAAEASVRKALKPIDDQRAASARRAGGGGGASSEADVPAGNPEATSKTPVPEVPA